MLFTVANSVKCIDETFYFFTLKVKHSIVIRLLINNTISQYNSVYTYILTPKEKTSVLGSNPSEFLRFCAICFAKRVA